MYVKLWPCVCIEKERYERKLKKEREEKEEEEEGTPTRVEDLTSWMYTKPFCKQPNLRIQ